MDEHATWAPICRVVSKIISTAAVGLMMGVGAETCFSDMPRFKKIVYELRFDEVSVCTGYSAVLLGSSHGGQLPEPVLEESCLEALRKFAASDVSSLIVFSNMQWKQIDPLGQVWRNDQSDMIFLV